MNEQSTQYNPTGSTILPAKRRRGRPRKDGGLAKRGNFQSPVSTPAPESIKKVQQNVVEVSQKESTIGGASIVGQAVSGVVDGCFDAGYFISVRVGNSATTLRGLVFQPGRFDPITPSNDVAPSTTMYHRNQVGSPLLNLQDQSKGICQPIQQEKQLNVAPGKVLLPKPMSSAPFVPNNQFAPVMTPPQSNTVMATNGIRSNILVQQNPDQRQIQYQSIPPVENLRMVEQDEVMQVFEVSNQPEGARINAEPAKRVLSESMLDSKASEGTSNQGPQAQNQLMGSIFQSDILFHSNHNSSGGEIHHNPAVAKSQEALDNQPIESESKNDKQRPDQSFMQTLLQPGEFVRCEAKKLEIQRAPIDDQTQFYPQGLPSMNTEIQLKEWTRGGQENQQNQFHQSSLFPELNSAAQETQAAETEIQPNDQVHNELKSTFLGQHMPQPSEDTNENQNPDINQVLITRETQAVPQESIRTSMDFMMENLSYPKDEESQNTQIGTEVEPLGNAEKSNETKEAGELGDKLVLGSLLAPQNEEANIENSDHSAKFETQNQSSDGGNNNMEFAHLAQENQP